MTRSEKKSHH